MPANGKDTVYVDTGKWKDRAKALPRSYNFVFETSSIFNHKGFYESNKEDVAYMIVIEKFNPYRECTDTSGWMQFETAMNEEEVYNFIGDNRWCARIMEGSPIQNDYHYTKDNQAYSRYGTFMWLIGSGLKPKRWNGSSWVSWDKKVTPIYSESNGKVVGFQQMPQLEPKAKYEGCSGHG